MRQLLVFALGRDRDIEVVEADNGLDALRKLKMCRFDIIVTDINMPIMDGLKLIQQARLDARHQDVPIVVITTEGAQADRDKAMKLGANTYVTKPIQAPQVIRAVRELLHLERRVQA